MDGPGISSGRNKYSCGTDTSAINCKYRIGISVGKVLNYPVKFYS